MSTLCNFTTESDIVQSCALYLIRPLLILHLQLAHISLSLYPCASESETSFVQFFYFKMIAESCDRFAFIAD